jgi:pseudaminic acid cytidylyltransferase
MKIAIIPARGGSKRIPRKNIKDFCGKPMIAWSIIAAIESKCFDRIVVSTDNDEIANIARSYGAEAPFKRPDELSDDFTGTIPVIAHATRWLINNGSLINKVCCIYATAPFIKPLDIQKGLRIIETTNADYAFSVTSFPFPIQRALKITKDNNVLMFHPEFINTRSQDLEEAWHDAGQFYWGNAKSWLDHKPVFSETSAPVILPRYRVQDIDSQEDWIRAEFMFKLV